MTLQSNFADDIIKKSGLFEPMFNDVVTIDPSRAEEAWDRLSVDTQKLELQSFNKILALAFYATLMESGKLNVPTKKIQKSRKAKISQRFCRPKMQTIASSGDVVLQMLVQTFPRKSGGRF